MCACMQTCARTRTFLCVSYGLKNLGDQDHVLSLFGQGTFFFQYTYNILSNRVLYSIAFWEMLTKPQMGYMYFRKETSTNIICFNIWWESDSRDITDKFSAGVCSADILYCHLKEIRMLCLSSEQMTSESWGHWRFIIWLDIDPTTANKTRVFLKDFGLNSAAIRCGLAFASHWIVALKSGSVNLYPPLLGPSMT